MLHYGANCWYEAREAMDAISTHWSRPLSSCPTINDLAEIAAREQDGQRFTPHSTNLGCYL